MSELLGRLRRAWSPLVSGYWFIPGGIVVAASAVALGLLELDARLVADSRNIGFTGGPESARALLSSIASSMLTLTALVFSVTIVVLQLASGQFSPRVLRTFLRDRRSQTTLGVFLATFLYALIVLRAVRGDGGTVDRFVPGISVGVSFALVVVSVAFFVQYIHNITTSIRVIEIIDRISKETAAAIERIHPADLQSADVAPPSLAAPSTTVCAATRGVVTSVNVDRLFRIAERADVCLAVVPGVGDFVATGMPLVDVHGDGDGEGVDDDAVRRAISLAKERQLDEDPAFGFRQLVDIAERTLSPGVNDPTTAVQCLDHLHDLLRRLAHRPLPPRVTRTSERGVRVVLPRPTWEDTWPWRWTRSATGGRGPCRCTVGSAPCSTTWPRRSPPSGPRWSPAGAGSWRHAETTCPLPNGRTSSTRGRRREPSAAGRRGLPPPQVYDGTHLGSPSRGTFEQCGTALGT
ncbi:MAG: DUF2254 domain-containing protein [Actinobacteria bacterium]|nr:DUF2254 domain-containing protein [Actinomycetota bacterium]